MFFWSGVVRGYIFAEKRDRQRLSESFAEEGIRFNVARSEFEPLSVELWRELGDGNASSQLDEESRDKVWVRLTSTR